MSDRTPRGKAARKKWSAERRTGRVNTHRANGAPSESTSAPARKVPIGEAMRLAVEQLGECVVDPGLAPTQLLELGEAYEQVAREQAAYDAKAEEAKTAKKALESAQQLLLEKVRTFTHPKKLPLFDAKQAETDRQAMTDAATH